MEDVIRALGPTNVRHLASMPSAQLRGLDGAASDSEGADDASERPYGDISDLDSSEGSEGPLTFCVNCTNELDPMQTQCPVRFGPHQHRSQSHFTLRSYSIRATCASCLLEALTLNASVLSMHVFASTSSLLTALSTLHRAVGMMLPRMPACSAAPAASGKLSSSGGSPGGPFSPTMTG